MFASLQQEATNNKRLTKRIDHFVTKLPAMFVSFNWTVYFATWLQLNNTMILPFCTHCPFNILMGTKEVLTMKKTHSSHLQKIRSIKMLHILYSRDTKSALIAEKAMNEKLGHYNVTVYWSKEAILMWFLFDTIASIIKMSYLILCIFHSVLVSACFISEPIVFINVK